MQPILLYKGDATDAFNVRVIKINLKTEVSLVNATARFSLLSFSKTFTNAEVLAKTFTFSIPAQFTRAFPLGLVYGSLMLYDADLRVMTAACNIPFVVRLPGTVGGGSVSVTTPIAEINVDVGVDYALAFNKPTINGVEVSGDKSGTDYGLNKILAYSQAKAYSVGDQVLKASSFYECVTAVQAGSAWDESKWHEIGGGIDPNAVHYTADTGKSDAERSQARQNIAAASVSDLSAHTANHENPHAVTKAQVGLGNVDNTADASKPVSTAQQTALNGKVDKVTGKGLSTNDFTTAEKTKLDSLDVARQVPTGGQDGQVLTQTEEGVPEWTDLPESTVDYEDLINLPKINSVELKGNKSAADLSLATSSQGSKADSALQHANFSSLPEQDLDPDEVGITQLCSIINTMKNLLRGTASAILLALALLGTSDVFSAVSIETKTSKLGTLVGKNLVVTNVTLSGTDDIRLKDDLVVYDQSGTATTNRLASEANAGAIATAIVVDATNNITRLKTQTAMLDADLHTWKYVIPENRNPFVWNIGDDYTYTNANSSVLWQGAGYDTDNGFIRYNGDGTWTASFFNTIEVTQTADKDSLEIEFPDENPYPPVTVRRQPVSPVYAKGPDIATTNDVYIVSTGLTARIDAKLDAAWVSDSFTNMVAGVVTNDVVVGFSEWTNSGVYVEDETVITNKGPQWSNGEWNFIIAGVWEGSVIDDESWPCMEPGNNDPNAGYIEINAPLEVWSRRDVHTSNALGLAYLRDVPSTNGLASADSVSVAIDKSLYASNTVDTISNTVYHSKTYFEVKDSNLKLIQDETNLVWMSDYELTNYLNGVSSLELYSGQIVYDKFDSGIPNLTVHIKFPKDSYAAGDALLRLYSAETGLVSIVTVDGYNTFTLKGMKEWNLIPAGDSLMMFTKTIVTNGVAEIWCAKQKSEAD